MAWETFERIIPYLSQAENVDFTGGGEPLINLRLPEMVAAAHQAGCRVGFSSNAVRLKRETASTLVDARLDWISFSVDAALPGLYEQIRKGANFQMIVDNIAGLHDLKQQRGLKQPQMMMVFVVMTGAQQNFHEFPAFIELAHRLGIEQVIAKNLDVILKDGDDERRVFAHDGNVAADVREALDEAERRAKALGIGLRRYSLQPQEVTVCEHNPTGSIFINWEGWVSPCITLAYAENRIFNGQPVNVPCQRYGKIGSEDLNVIWSTEEYLRFREQFERRLSVEQQATIDHMLGGPAAAEHLMPPAPEGCRTCYYLYGV